MPILGRVKSDTCRRKEGVGTFCTLKQVARQEQDAAR